MAVYEVNNTPTAEKIEEYNRNKNTFYRFQCKDWEMGTKSWGMIYSSEEEALEDGSTVLDGKSAWSTAKKLYNMRLDFDNDFCVMVLQGSDVETGHDGESVVDVENIVEIWSREDFIAVIEEMLDTEASEEWWF